METAKFNSKGWRFIAPASYRDKFRHDLTFMRLRFVGNNIDSEPVSEDKSAIEFRLPIYVKI